MTWTTRPRSDHQGLSTITAGSGPLVVLLHGVGLRAEAWNAQIDALSSTCQTWAFDMPGHGNSPFAGSDLALGDYVQSVANAIPGPAVIIGHSMGSMIALELARLWPGKVAGVVALNAIFRRDLQAGHAVRNRANALDGKTMADPSVPLDRWFGTAPSPERAACHNWLTTVDPAGYRSAYQVFAQQDGPEDATLTGLHCPALFMTGEQDPNSTPGMARAMAQLTPEGHASVIETAAHMMPMTHTSQVNDALLSFIAACTE